MLAILGLVWTINALISLGERLIGMARGLRAALGFSAPAIGPDWWVLGTVAIIGIAGFLILLWAYSAYHSAINCRLASTWGPVLPAHTKLPGRTLVASTGTVQAKSAYLSALANSPGWNRADLAPASTNSDDYRDAAIRFLREIEADVAHRALTVGLVIGLNRNPLIDTFTIVAAALELQLHVLTRLGRRPSLGTWMELAKRASASIFLNTYVTREDALYLNLAIRKAALGLEVTSEAVQTALADVDIDEVVGQTAVPGLSELTHIAAFGLSVGASGLRQIGNFIEHTANDLLQGVLAGGVLYFHGMALASECLALDEQHRRSPEMTRTISQAMLVACAPAGQLLRDQVRNMRQLLRERRRLIFSTAKDKVGGAASKVSGAVKGLADRASTLFRAPQS